MEQNRAIAIFAMENELECNRVQHDADGVSGIILAGGKNVRMGTEKALLKVGPHFIIEKISAVFRSLVNEILVVTSRPEAYATYGDVIISDILPGHGPLSGIHAGLVHASYSRAVVTACDTPFISTNLLTMLIKSVDDHDVVVPRYRGFLEPLCALYGKGCIEIIENQLIRGYNKITGFYDLAKVKYLEEDEMRAVEPELDRVFFNVNTPEDLKKAQSFVSYD